MNSIFIKNQQTESNKGTGLPFYSKTNYQYRFQNKASVMVYGYWDVPNNKIPTFQVWNGNTLDRIALIKVSGKNDVSTNLLDFGILRETCLNDGTSIYSYRDNDTLDINLDCGVYYLRIYNSVDANLGDFYSECFTIGEVINAEVGISLSQIGATLSVQLRSNLDITSFAYNLTPPAGTGLTIGIPAPYSTSIVFSLLVGQTSDLIFFIVTDIGEIFTDKYTVSRPISDYVLTKQYT